MYPGALCTQAACTVCFVHSLVACCPAGNVCCCYTNRNQCIVNCNLNGSPPQAFSRLDVSSRTAYFTPVKGGNGAGGGEADTAVQYDLLVGADGVNSRVREGLAAQARLLHDHDERRCFAASTASTAPTSSTVGGRPRLQLHDSWQTRQQCYSKDSQQPLPAQHGTLYTTWVCCRAFMTGSMRKMEDLVLQTEQSPLCLQVPGFSFKRTDLDSQYKCFHRIPNDGVAPVRPFVIGCCRVLS